MSRTSALFRIRVGRWWWAPGLWPTVAAALLLPALLGLGVWQLHRADYKRQLQAEYDQYQSEPAAPLASEMRGIEALQFHRLRVHGWYEADRQILIDNRIHQGRPGYEVLTPLHIDGGTVRILVNRGWVAAGPDRQPPPIDTPAETVEVTGVAMVPAPPGLVLGDVHAPGPNWPVTWQYLDIRDYAHRAAFPVLPVVLLLDPDSPAGGFVRQWARLDTGIQTHQGYALTWFSLAAALVAIYVLVNARRDDHVHPGNS
jgi:surfeit locus 1 family protein